MSYHRCFTNRQATTSTAGRSLKSWSHKLAPLERIAADLRAVLAAHVTFELVDRRRLRPAHNVQSDRLMRIASETANFKVATSRVERVAQGRDGCAGPL